MSFLAGRVLTFHIKKVRGFGDVGNNKTKMVEKWRGMSIQERCLMVEQAIYAEEELTKVPREFKEMWDCL